MGNIIDHVAEQYKTAELVLIAEQVGLAPTSRWGNRKLVDVVLRKLNKDGIPEPPKEGEETRKEILLEDFLCVARLVDEDGSTTKGGGDVIDEQDVDAFMVLHNISKQPDCFTFADDEDPACKRCIVYRFCAESRLANLPPCFGNLFDLGAEECKICLEEPFCKKVLN